MYYIPFLLSAKEKNGQKQVKKKAFKINAKIEDVMVFAFKFCCQLFSLYYIPFLLSAKEKNGQKQVKKKAFRINAKIEDVGLNED